MAGESHQAVSGRAKGIRLLLAAGLALGAACQSQWASRQPQDASSAPQLHQAESAYFRLDLAAARQEFEKCLNEPTFPASDRAEAARRLAAIAWRFDQDWTRALALLERAEGLEKGAFENALARSRLLQRQGRIGEASQAAAAALQRASSKEEQLEAATALGRLALQQVHHAGSGFSGLQELGGALAKLLESLQANRGRLEASRVALGLALAADEGQAALWAWRSYYWVPSRSGDPGHGDSDWLYARLAEPHAMLSTELPGWAGPDTDPQVRARVVQALADSFFFAEAAWLATDPRVDAKQQQKRPEIRQIVAYSHFLESLQQASREFYRRRSLGLAPSGELRKTFLEQARQLWPRLSWPHAPAAFSESSFLKEISQRFGAEVAFRTHHGTPSIVAGHRVVDEMRSVRQYGRQAEIRLMVLDHLASDSYTTWFWDGEAATGGWVSEKGIAQLRPAYADGPLRAWNQISDPAARQELEEEIAQKSAADDAIARADPYAYLPGLALRLRHQSHRSLLERLRSSGLEGSDLQEAFVTQLERLTRASSIDAHEGRHALDRLNTIRNAFRSASEKEYRAKLSEVALAPDPRLALTGGILSANIGDGSSHGQANQRLMRGLVAWMKENASQVQGLDSTRPMLPQLDKLTDQQLRQAVRSMDPWARQDR